MNDLIAASRQALEALENVDGIDTETECVTIDVGDEITALRTAIHEWEAAEKQEPVACKKLCELCLKRDYDFCANAAKTTPIPTPPAALAAPVQEPSPGGILFAVEQAIRNGHCPWEIESAFDAYEAERKAMLTATPPAAPVQELTQMNGKQPPAPWNTPAAQRQWVGLTAGDRKKIERQSVYVEGAIRMTEALLREKNGGAV